MGHIVWVTSYPKSGNTWVRAFIYNLLVQPAKPAPLSELSRFFQGETKPRWYLPYAAGKNLAELEAAEVFSMRRQVHHDIALSSANTVFAKSHSPFGSFNGYPLQNTQVMSGAVYIMRNPLDVVLSVSDHFGLGIDESISFLANEQNGTPTTDSNVADFLGSWSNHVSTWTQKPQPQLVILKYEDLLDRPRKGFAAVARLLGFGSDSRRIHRAVEFSAFRQLKRLETRSGFSERSPHSRCFFRKGSKHQWANALSDDQIARVVDDHREQMQRFNYIPPRYRKSLSA
ncbi:MAG TPA: sulfotransferase domain-containing protein [Xanthomonadales bacterium]|nr:sulfotransferase domain-containing protein [Xanthomonadales bacterium]